MSTTDDLFRQIIAAFPMPPVDVGYLPAQVEKSVMLLPNLVYPLRANTYVPQRCGISASLVIKEKAEGGGTPNVVVNLNRDVVVGTPPDGLAWAKVLFTKNISVVFGYFKAYRSKLRRPSFF